MDYYNQKRCVDGKGLVLPSQIVSSLCNVLIRWRIGDSGVITIVSLFFLFSGKDVLFVSSGVISYVLLFSVEVCQIF